MSQKKSPFDPFGWCNICSFRADKAFKGFGCTPLGSQHTCKRFVISSNRSSLSHDVPLLVQELTKLLIFLLLSPHHRVTTIIPNHYTMINAALGNLHMRLKAYQLRNPRNKQTNANKTNNSIEVHRKVIWSSLSWSALVCLGLH